MGMLGKLGIRPKIAETPAEDGLDAGPVSTESARTRKQARSEMGPLFSRHDNENNQSRAQSTTIRVLLGMVGLVSSIAVIEAVALTELIPMHTVEPYLVTFSDKQDQMVRIDPPTGHIGSLGIVLRKEIHDYIMARYTVTPDATETNDRWNTHIRLFSTQRVYADFQGSEVAQMKDMMSANKFTRAVSIVSVTNPEPGLFHVDFDTFDHITGTGLSDSQDKTGHFTATLKVGMQPRSVPRSEISLNPFGFVVATYSVSPRHVNGT